MFDNLRERLTNPSVQGDVRMARGLGTAALLCAEASGALMAKAPMDANSTVIAVTGAILFGAGAVAYARDALRATRPDQV